MKVGYSWLAERAEIKAPVPEHYAEVRSVTRIEVIGRCIAVPPAVAPAQDSLLGHTLFALKHEGVNLTILAQALPLIPAAELCSAYGESPTSQFLRKVCYLWEYFSGRELARPRQSLRTNYVPLFNPDIYLTSTGTRNTRWRILFNGLGTLDYCVTVRKTPELMGLLGKGLLQQASEFTESLPADILNRTLAWAYLDETRNSYAIENEVPSGDKATRFVNLLKQAHLPRQLDEEYLVDLQNAAINNVFYQAASFRTEQNYLSNGLRGALGVSYLPPPPELSRQLMERLMKIANTPPAGIDPLVLAAVVSFGFVFIHPFMDGNGRLSRFLFHQVLCQQGALKNGLLLPVSAILKQKETDYKAALEAWSAPSREYWDVTFIDEEQLEFDFNGHPALYCYWDATQCVSFMAGAAEQAIEQHLKQETAYLNRFDAIYRHIDSAFDVANSDLSRLVMFCMDQHGKLSANRRKQYQYKVPEDVFDALEQAYKKVAGESANND
ncbi:MAG: cell filamentation protein Fic, partial [Gammaproteobacteria bacterium]